MSSSSDTLEDIDNVQTGPIDIFGSVFKVGDLATPGDSPEDHQDDSDIFKFGDIDPGENTENYGENNETKLLEAKLTFEEEDPEDNTDNPDVFDV